MKRLITLLIFVTFTSSAFATTHYVDLNSSSPTPPYTTRATAANTIQDAVDVSVAGDTVRVATGEYVLSSQVTVPINISVISESGPQLTIINGNGITRGFLLDGTCLISGFTITNGIAFGADGGGIYCGSDLSIASNCTFVGNTAHLSGGGMHQGTAYNCSFYGNMATDGGGVYQTAADNCSFFDNTGSDEGGGMYKGTANNCTFSNNIATVGGGMHAYVSMAANNCSFIDNKAHAYGGGMYYGTANNCIFSGNTANNGGGMHQGAANNCTFFGNSAGYSGGGIIYCTARNSIFVENTATYGNNFYESTLYSSCSEGVVTNDGYQNIAADPLFLDTGDFHLQPDSPCIDAGYDDFVTSSTDLDGSPRIHGLAVDMGAYEFTGDTDNDGLDDAQELSLGTDPLKADTDADGLLDGEEVNTYLTNPLLADTDNDGLSDSEELEFYFTDPLELDSDGDGASDGDEINRDGTDPNNPNDADIDSDGISDFWEIRYFGSPTNCIPTDDPDDDLYTNSEEFSNGTDPIIWDIYVANYTAIELVWKMVPGTTYQLQCASTLSSNTWENVGNAIVGDGTTNAVLNSTRGAEKKFYRVITLP